MGCGIKGLIFLIIRDSEEAPISGRCVRAQSRVMRFKFLILLFLFLRLLNHTIYKPADQSVCP